MAKPDNTKKPAKEKAPATEKPAKAAPETFKYGVGDLADALGIAETSVRVGLRNKGIKKAGKSYGWNTKDELNEVVAKLRPAKEEKAKPAKKAKSED